MKRSFVIYLFFMCLGCNPFKLHLGRADIVVIWDITDPLILNPEYKVIQDLFDFRNNLCKAAYFKLTYIGDMNLMKEYEFALDNRSVGEYENRYDDPQFRRKEVIKFLEHVHDGIERAKTYADGNTGKEHSECFRRIASELTALSKRLSRQKVLIVYSDVSENSDIFNAYKEVEGRVIDNQRAIEYIKNRFEKVDLLPKSLNGITVYFIYEPQTVEEDKRFALFTRVYRELLEPRGAHVLIKSTNTFQNSSHE